MLAPRQPPPPTHALRGLLPRMAALALSLAMPVACFKDGGAELTSEVTLAGSSSSSGVDSTTGTGGESSGSAATPTTGTTGITGITGITSTGITSTGTTGECVDIWYFDIDGDGFGGPEQTEGCGPPPPGFTVDSLDCDDTNNKIHPGGEELCDGADNDCDLGVDEWPAMDQPGECNGCRAVEHEAHYYYFCQTPPSPWQAARARCQLLLGDLTVIDTATENQFLVSTIEQQGKRWWIGLSDLALEGEFEWVDGTPLGPKVTMWANGEPDNEASDAPGEANCAALFSDLILGTWRDQVCETPYAFVCEAAGS